MERLSPSSMGCHVAELEPIPVSGAVGLFGDTMVDMENLRCAAWVN